MLLQVLRRINNFFETDENTGTFTITSETLTGDFAILPLVGQYILIEPYGKDRLTGMTGSRLNAGIYLVGDEEITLAGAKNEVWQGTVYNLVIPSDVLESAQEIAQNVASTPQTNLVSESFGAASLSRATDKNGQVATWVDVYRAKLNELPRRMRKTVRI